MSCLFFHHKHNNHILNSLINWSIPVTTDAMSPEFENCMSPCVQIIADIWNYQRAMSDVVDIIFKTSHQTIKHGISGNIFFIPSFLANRSEIVKINSSNSISCHVQRGVVQGSVIGLMLFNIFINDVANHVYRYTVINLFTDDIKFTPTQTPHQPVYKHNPTTFTNGHSLGKYRSHTPNVT